MNCAVNYCIYNDNYACVLSEIAINSAGQCEECIMAAIPQDVLEKYKQSTRRRLDIADASF